MELEWAGELESMNQRSAFAMDIRRDTAMQIISQICMIEIIALNSQETTDTICERHCLHPVQHFFHKKVLDTIRQRVNQEYIYHAIDAFGVHLLLFSVSGTPYLFGPFCCQPLSEYGARTILKQNELDEIEVKDLQYYSGSFPQIEAAEAVKIASSFIYTVNPEEPSKTIKVVTGIEIPPSEEETVVRKRPNYKSKLEYRYALENRFIEEIKNGNAHSALSIMNVIEQDVAYLKRLGPAPENERIGITIARTTIRHAALQVGLPVLIIDRISSANTTLVSKAKTVGDIMIAKEIMIRDFCKAIREMRENKYSALVQSVLYCLNHDYSSSIDLPSLSDELGISESRLVKNFKKEIGLTPSAYLAKIRMQKAALLLISGTMPVSEISTAVGINDSNYFVKLFKKEFDEAPTAYRKRHTT